MTEIGNRIYPLGRDKRVSVHGCGGEEGWGGTEHADLLLVGREVWQLGLLMRGRALLEPAEHRPLGFRVLPVFTMSGGLTGHRLFYQAPSEWGGGIPPATFHKLRPRWGFFRRRPGEVAFNGQSETRFTQSAFSCGSFFRLPAAARIYVIIDYSCIVWSWLTASDIYAYARVCIWIPLFLTRHAHARTHKHTKMHRCNHAARIPSCADPHRRTRRTLSLLVVVVLDILSISLCPKSRVRLMPLSTGAGRRSLSHTQTLCSKTYVTVFLSLSLSLSLSRFVSVPLARRPLSDFITVPLR